jgi:hypothetical protein
MKHHGLIDWAAHNQYSGTWQAIRVTLDRISMGWIAVWIPAGGNRAEKTGVGSRRGAAREDRMWQMQAPGSGWERGPAAVGTQAAQAQQGGPLDWWYRLTTPPAAPVGAALAERERTRRGRLASTIMLGLLVVEVLVLPIGFSDPATLYGVLFGIGATLVALVLNRTGHIAVAGALLVVELDAALFGATLGAPGGQLDLIYVPIFDLLVMTELIAVSLLAPVSVFVVAAVNSLLIVADVNLQPPTAAFAKLLGTADGYTVEIRPIVLQIVVAVVTYLWVRSALQAIRRADRAEEIAELQARAVLRQRELEEGVHELLAVHVRLANGDFNARTPPLRNQLLWQIGLSLNNLISRFARLGQADFVLQRTAEEAHRLLDALSSLRTGRRPIWPAPSGTPLDEVIRFLHDWLAPGGNTVAGQIAGTPGPWNQLPSGSQASFSRSQHSQYPPDPSRSFARPPQPASQPAPLDVGSELPDWLRGPQAPQPDPEALLPDWLRPQPSGGGAPRQWSSAPPAPQGDESSGQWPDVSADPNPWGP